MEGRAEHTEHKREGTPHPVDRRKFLQASGLAAGGAVLAYSTPTVLAGGANRDLSGPPYNCDEMPDLESLVNDFSFTPTAQANLTALAPIGQKLLSTPSVPLTEEEVGQLWDLGWLPAAELNDDDTARNAINSALRLPDESWSCETDNQNDFLMPQPNVARARFQNLNNTCSITALALIVVIVLVVVLVIDFPSPAYCRDNEADSGG